MTPEYAGPNSRMWLSVTRQPDCPMLLVAITDREENTQLNIQLTPDDAEGFADLLYAAAQATRQEIEAVIDSLV